MATDVNKNIHAKVRTLFRTHAKRQSQMKLLSPDWFFYLISRLVVELDSFSNFLQELSVSRLPKSDSARFSRKFYFKLKEQKVEGVKCRKRDCNLSLKLLKMNVFMVYCMDSIKLSHIVISDTVCKICDLNIFINCKTVMHNIRVF